MPKIKLVTNVSEYALLRGLAATRGRLVASTLLVTGAMVGLGLWSAHWVLEVSDSVVLNLLLITMNMMVMLVAAYLQTVLVGDLFFSGPWRDQVILGKTPAGGASVSSHNAEFMIVLLLLVVGNALAINFASGGFLDTYHDEGFFRARLRSDDASERLAAIEDITDGLNFELWDRPGIRQLVLDHLDDPDEEVRKAAIWDAGEMELDAAREPLIELVAGAASVEVRARAAEALGKLGNDTEAREALEDAVSTSDQRDLKIGALRGLALMKSPLAIDTVRPLTRAEDEDVKVHAYWVLRTSGDTEIRPMLREALQRDPTKLERCAILDTLKMVATEDDVVWARRQFASAPPKESCDPVRWEERNERVHWVLYSDSFQVKYLKIVANAAAAENRGWFERLLRDPNQTWRVREVANEIVRQLDEAGQ